MVDSAGGAGQGRARLELLLGGEDETLALGRALGGLCQAGEVLLLKGELGAGKTSLARGLAVGLGVDPAYVITSPTFTLLNVYPGRLAFFHADLYRLGPGEAADLELTLDAAAGVLAVEWPERAPDLWPAGAVLVELAQAGPDQRRAVVSGPAWLIQRLKTAMQN